MVCRLLISLTLFIANFFSARAADYYWVGGSGNWSDIRHWVTTSGGAVQHNTIPTANDRVFFDEQSFTNPGQIVTVNTPTAFCKDMDWTGAIGQSVFRAEEGYVLQVHGALILNPDMVFDFKGDVDFIANEPNNEIKLAGQKLLRDVTFTGNSGGWILMDGFATAGVLRMVSGNFKSSGFPVSSEFLYIQPSGNLEIDLDASYLTVSGKTYMLPNTIDPEPVGEIINEPGLILRASEASIDFTSTDVYFRIKNAGNIDLGTVLLSSTIGSSRLQVESPDPLELYINKLEMRNDAELEGPMKFGELLLGEGKNFVFDAGYSYELEQLKAEGTCSLPIQLFSSEPGREAIFQAAEGVQTGTYLSIRDIHASGGATFSAANSADLGNTSGWIISPKANTSLFWVGGSGDWNDPAHWAVTSGGPGGACVPTAGDDVFFDENSFPVANAKVNLDVDNAYCRSMDWTGAIGNPALVGTFEKNLHVFGSLTFITEMELGFEGDVFFESNSEGNAIMSSGKAFNKDIFFDGQGSWLLLDSLDVAKDVFFDKGKLNTNDQVMACERFISEFDFQRILQLGNSHIKLRSSNYNYLNWWLNADNLIFDAGTSTIEFFWYGDLLHLGTPQLEYHHIIFNKGAGLNSLFHQLSHIIDTLETRGGSWFSSNTRIGTWLVSRGSDHRAIERDTIFVDNLIAAEGCNGMIEFRSNHQFNQAYISHTGDLTLDRIVLHNFHSVGPGVLTATNSVNLGNSDGWVLSQNEGRELYWVGGAGQWHETEHWSLSSGGPGGECVPTPLDNVYFDENSFSDPNNAWVNMDERFNYCKNLRWSNLPFNSSLVAINFQVFGSIETSPDVTFDYVFRLVLRSDEIDNQIKIGGVGIVENFEIDGSGSFVLVDSLQARNMLHTNGTFNSNGYKVELEYYTAGWFWDVPKTLILEGSHWKVNGGDQGWRQSWGVYGPVNFVVDSSLVEFTHPIATVYSDYGLRFNNVLFSAVDQESKIETINDAKGTFNRLEFRNDGVIYGAQIIDSLIFFPGKSYRLDAYRTQTVNDYLQMIGNNCLSIGLSSTVQGLQSKLVMNGGSVLADFVQMRDQLAEGSTDFFAGNNSTNIAESNTGWIFESAEDYIDDGILGRDIVLCENTAFELDGRTYSPNETYLWSTGVTSPTIGVNQPGTYWVEVNYGDNCILRDSVVLLEPEKFVADLPSDTTLCEGETLVLNQEIDLLGLQFLWQDGSTGNSFLVTEPGNYKLTLELSGCATSDSIMVDYTPNPVVDLGQDLNLCPEESATIDATNPEATSYRWQDESMQPELMVSAPGTYVAEVFIGRCIGSDTLNVLYEPPIGLDLGDDRLICEGADLKLSALTVVGGAIDYLWKDGATSKELTVNEEGVYWVEVTRNGCSERDSIEISQIPLPSFDLGLDQILCESETVALGSDLTDVSFLWSDGTTTGLNELAAAGLYWLEADREGCKFRDSVLVTVVTLPENRLGADQTICEGELLVLDASVSGAEYLWQDGSTVAQLGVETAGVYEVEISIGECIVTDQVSVSVTPLPEFELGPDLQLCAPESVLLQVTTSADNYRWQDGSSLASITANESGLYAVTATKDGCSWTDSVQIYVFNPPKPNLGADTIICEDTPFLLKADVPAQSFLWQDGNTNDEYEVTVPGEYILSVLEGACAARDTIFIDFRRCAVFNAFLPNAFSPNGDGINDGFRPYLPPDVEVTDYLFRVFDRWGNLVFETNQTDREWDGSFRGEILPQGVFLYFINIKYRDDFGEDETQLKGDVLLTR